MLRSAPQACFLFVFRYSPSIFWFTPPTPALLINLLARWGRLGGWMVSFLFCFLFFYRTFGLAQRSGTKKKIEV
jgi:hypothetical protein